MKKSKIAGGVKKALKIPSFLAASQLHMILMFLVVGFVGVTGVKLTLSSLAATQRPNGTLDIITYEGSADPGNEIGGVDVVVAGDASHPQITCTPSSGTTDSAGGSNHGHLHLTCPAALNGGLLAYKFVSASRAGYSLSSSPHPAGDVFHVRAGPPTTLSLVLNRTGGGSASSSSSTPTYTATPVGASSTAAPGYLDIITYEGSWDPGNEIGSVYVQTTQGGSGVQCSPSSGTTNPDSGGNHGHIHMTCPGASNGGPRAYRFVSASRDGYTLSSSPHPAGEVFHITEGQTTTFKIVMNRTSGPASSTAASSSDTGGTRAPSSAPSSTSNRPQSSSSATITASQKRGSVQLTTYVYHPNGSKTRLGGVNVHIQSIGSPTTDSAHSCDNYNQTTESTDTPATNTNYGQAHFAGCWTGSGGSKAYQLSYVEIPAGYSFRSYRLTGPAGASFVSGGTVTTAGLNEQFSATPDQETKLEIWLTSNSESEQGLAGVRQVVTQSGRRYVAGSNTEGAKQAAAALNAVSNGAVDLNDISAGLDDNVDTADDTNPPSAPTNFKATQDESGSVSLSWGASVGDPVGENVTYSIQRGIKDSGGDLQDVGDTTTDLTTLDNAEDLEYPQTYVYQVTAEDDAGNISDPAIVEITTKPVTSNAHPSDIAADASTQDQTSTSPDSGATVITSHDKNASLDLPASAVQENLACTVSDSTSVGADLLTSLGDTTGNAYLPVCRDDTGNIVDDFSSEVDMSVEVDNTDVSSDTELYGFDGVDWVQIPTDQGDQLASGFDTTHGNLTYTNATKVNKDGKTTYTVKTKKLFSMALVKKKHNSKGPLIPIITLVSLVPLVLLTRVIIRRRIIARYAANPYGDTDLMPTQPSMSAPPEVRYVVHPDNNRQKGKDES